jgi:hypothetical protein
MAKMRLQCAVSYRFITLILGVKSLSTVCKHLNPWIAKWGEAGIDLSILDIDEDFLTATLPQAYIDEGLTKICAVPDGKDFKVHTPCRNALFTRACWSDNVEASAVRCISY